MPYDRQDRGSGGLSLQTLVISSAAAVAAAVVVPLFWAKGTIVATAITPIIVALVSEALRKPAERISAVTPRVARRTATGAAVRRFEPEAAQTRRPERVGARGEGPERAAPRMPAQRAPNGTPEDPFGLRAADRRRPRLKIALVTGLLAFVAAAAFVTVSELALFDGSVSGERGRTTIFGGQQRDAPEDREATPEATREATPEEDAAAPTPTPEGEATPTPTATPTAPAEPTPTVTVTPPAPPAP